MACGLVHASYSLPEWQAVKLAFFAPCVCCLDLFSINKIFTARYKEELLEL